MSAVEDFIGDSWKVITPCIGAIVADDYKPLYGVCVSEANYITNVSMWHNGDCIKGMRVSFSDGHVWQLGKEDGGLHSHNLPADLNVVRVMLNKTNWRDGKFDGMRFWTRGEDLNKDPALIWGNWGNRQFSYDFPAGVQLAGANMTIGSDFDIFQLVLTKPVLQYVWSQVEYDDSVLSPINEPSIVNSQWVYNKSSDPQTSQLHSEKSVSDTNTHTIEHSYTVGAKISFGNDKSFVKGEVSYEYTAGASDGATFTTTKLMSATANPTLPPRSKLFASIVMTTETGTQPFKAVLTLHYGGGTTRVLPVNGVYTNVTHTSYNITYGPTVALTDEEML